MTADGTGVAISKYNGSAEIVTIPETIGNMEPQDVRNELGKVRDCANQISMDMSKVLEKGQKERSAEAR